jgi:hypothetical protein
MLKIAFVFLLALPVLFSVSLSSRADETVPADPVLTRLQAEWPVLLDDIHVTQADEATLEITFLKFTRWSAEAQPFTVLLPNNAQAQVEFASAVDLAITRAQLRCVNDHNVHQTAKIMRLVKWATSHLEIASILTFHPAELLEKAAHCAHFDLSFDTSMTLSTESGTIRLRTHSLTPLASKVTEDSIALTGTSTLDYTQVSWPPISSCSVSAIGQGVPFKVTGSNFEIAMAPGSELIRSLNLSISFEKPTEQVTLNCPSGFSQKDNHTWWSSWYARHVRDMSHTLSDTFEITDWEMDKAGVFATRSFLGKGPGAISENTQFRLVHTPIL